MRTVMSVNSQSHKRDLWSLAESLQTERGDLTSNEGDPAVGSGRVLRTNAVTSEHHYAAEHATIGSGQTMRK